jgi:hypothetical protein
VQQVVAGSVTQDAGTSCLVGRAQLVDGVVVGVGDVREPGRRIHGLGDVVEQVAGFEFGSTEAIPRLQMSLTCIGVVVTAPVVHFAEPGAAARSSDCPANRFQLHVGG